MPVIAGPPFELQPIRSQGGARSEGTRLCIRFKQWGVLIPPSVLLLSSIRKGYSYSLSLSPSLTQSLVFNVYIYTSIFFFFFFFFFFFLFLFLFLFLSSLVYPLIPQCQLFLPSHQQVPLLSPASDKLLFWIIHKKRSANSPYVYRDLKPNTLHASHKSAPYARCINRNRGQ